MDVTIDREIDDLSRRFEDDYKRMERWRQFHRFAGMVLVLITVGIPGLVAVGILDAAQPIGRVLVGLASVAAGLTAGYKPLVHSIRRRNDMNRSRFLSDRFRIAIAGALDAPHKTTVCNKFADEFRQLYDDRGSLLVEHDLVAEARGSATEDQEQGHNEKSTE